jgi:hypothetical protein
MSPGQDSGRRPIGDSESRLGLRGSSGSLLCLLLLLGGLLLILGGLGGSTLTLSVVGRGPEGKVVTEELHDQSAVTVRLLRQRVELSNGIIKGLLGKVASTVGRVEDLVVEHGEVQGETEADGVSGGELGLSDVGGALNKGEAIRN